MIYYNRIDISEEVDVNNTSKSKEYDTCHYWYFLNKRIKFQPSACSNANNLLLMSMNFNDIAILNVQSQHYCCIISTFSKNESINLMQKISI